MNILGVSHREFAEIMGRIDYLILSTPTGEARNHLTGASMHMAEAYKLLTSPPTPKATADAGDGENMA